MADNNEIKTVKELVAQRGLKLTYVAGMLNMPYSTFNRKLANNKSFTLTEVAKLKSLLNLSTEDVDKYFLS